MKKIVIIFLLSIALLGFLASLFYTGRIWFNMPSQTEYPIRGIDISHHQGKIDWTLLNNEGYDFIFMKATEGKDFVDPMFQANWNRAKKEGYRVGAYHFYRLCTDWKEQLANIVKIVPKQKDTLPVVLDLEFMGNCATPKSVENIRKDILNLIVALHKQYEKKPILYVTDEFYEKYLIGYVDDYALWYRSIVTKPHIKGEQNWLFWQYSNRGRVKGIQGYVDQNVFHGDADKFKAFVSE